MTNPLESRLRPFVALTKEERLLLDEIIGPAKEYKPKIHILSDASYSSDTYILTSGCAFEYRILREGGRQIIRLLLPGDIFFASMSRAPRSDFVALNECYVQVIQQHSFGRLMSFPRLRQAWLLALQLDNDALLEHVVRIGRKSALARTAHFLAETYYRMEARGLTSNLYLPLPFTQQALGDILGFSTVHMNRVLHQLLDMKIISYCRQKIEVLDEARLKRVGEFFDGYVSPDMSLVITVDQDEVQTQVGSKEPRRQFGSAATSSYS